MRLVHCRTRVQITPAYGEGSRIRECHQCFDQGNLPIFWAQWTHLGDIGESLCKHSFTPPNPVPRPDTLFPLAVQ